jgi:hypothetical protein
MFAIKNLATGLYYPEVELSKTKIHRQKKNAEQIILHRIPKDDLDDYAIVKLQYAETDQAFSALDITVDKEMDLILWNRYQSGPLCKLYEKLRKEDKLEQFRYAIISTRFGGSEREYNFIKKTVKSLGINRNMVKHVYWSAMAFSNLDDLMMVKVALGDKLSGDHCDLVELREWVKLKFNS